MIDLELTNVKSDALTAPSNRVQISPAPNSTVIPASVRTVQQELCPICPFVPRYRGIQCTSLREFSAQDWSAGARLRSSKTRDPEEWKAILDKSAKCLDNS